VDFNKHSRLEGTHAFLSASNHHWLRYTDDKLVAAFTTAQAAARGTRMHALARECIEMRVRLPDTGETLNTYVNDAIGFGMRAEQILFYSFNCYGTADTIGYNEPPNRRPKLRISDYKSGRVKTSEDQLYVYDGLFCLEYNKNPYEIDHELRIYQNNEVRFYQGEPDYVEHVMERIVTFNQMIEDLRRDQG
jgi:hypothetical protein